MLKPEKAGKIVGFFCLVAKMGNRGTMGLLFYTLFYYTINLY